MDPLGAHFALIDRWRDELDAEDRTLLFSSHNGRAPLAARLSPLLSGATRAPLADLIGGGTQDAPTLRTAMVLWWVAAARPTQSVDLAAADIAAVAGLEPNGPRRVNDALRRLEHAGHIHRTRRHLLPSTLTVVPADPSVQVHHALITNGHLHHLSGAAVVVFLAAIALVDGRRQRDAEPTSTDLRRAAGLSPSGFVAAVRQLRAHGLDHVRLDPPEPGQLCTPTNRWRRRHRPSTTPLHRRAEDGPCRCVPTPESADEAIAGWVALMAADGARRATKLFNLPADAARERLMRTTWTLDAIDEATDGVDIADIH
ncbi:hypothetical protein DVS28_b0343 (plasmid) [Euzebya pacifica]|uniref:Uncharacterized protein n=1 Tax=Euzebya pacifica TaxID=1608957 RepID=A0A346Y6L6_9ACTN|nr:hypothetical protein [Euzebya pacifica]AXV10113.1 hypothetical protein DVS28_b0343 [Euzebya pacifica]